jgi:Raf kinase inhibitor-like YbhB/YbcL family protein
MLLTSPSFENGMPIPRKFSGEGGNINPELEIQNVPDGAKSLVLILHDTDAPRPGGFTHWIVWNIDPGTQIIKQESIAPGSREGMNDGGTVGYIGPYPGLGHGIHHYHFGLYALDAMLDIPPDIKRAELLREIKKHLIEETELIGTYERK